MFLKRILSSLTTIALCASFILPIHTFAATSFTGGSDVSGGLNVQVSITDLQVTGAAPGDTVPVFLYVPAGSLSMTTTTGLTFTGGTSGQRLYFSGTLTDVNAALATLQYRHSSAGTFTLEASIIGAGQIYNPTNQHIYEVVNHGSPITATTARSAALARSINGVSGYLANITSGDENSFVQARITQDGWFGASDAAVEGDWVWLDGPESGTLFWQGNNFGEAFGYENWAVGEWIPGELIKTEPNQAGDEDCSQFYANGSGWNDLPCGATSISTYIVEYGNEEEGGDGVVNIDTKTLDITLSVDSSTQAPTLTSPGSNSRQNTLQLTYSLPETPFAGSVNVVFHNGTNGNTYIMGDEQSVDVPMFLYRGASFFEEPLTYAGVREDYLLLGPGAWPGMLPDGTYTVTLSYRDSLGNTASTDVATAVTIDTTAPSAPIIIKPSTTKVKAATEITLSGTCETDATISISAEELITNPTTGTCVDGAFSIPMHFSTDAVDSTFSIDVTQTDLAGNESSVTTKEIQYINIGGGGKPSTENATPEIIQNQTSPNEKISIKDETSENIETREEIIKNPLNSAEESTCSKDDYLKHSIKFGRYNNPQDVKLLEEFLNTYEDAHLVVDGIYSKEDFDAVIKWQEKYSDDILKPWGIKKGTGYVYKKSLLKIKEVVEKNCPKEPQKIETQKTAAIPKKEEN